MNTLKASHHPKSDIESIAWAGQPAHLRQYRPGYEWAMDTFPELQDNDHLLPQKVKFALGIMEDLAANLKQEDWVANKQLDHNTFERTILAIEPPQVQQNGGLKEGAEIIVAQWGPGFASHVHGHAVGYMHEAVLKGKVKVNTYRLIDPTSTTVRAVRTDIVGEGTFVSRYTPANPAAKFKRQTLIHNFVALETTSTLHFLPEHTRDKRDNAFTSEFFEDVHHLSFKDVTPITGLDAMYLPKGEVVLVRSDNVPELGDHYIVITGHPIVKPHGLRPQEIAIQAPHANVLLDFYGDVDVYQGLTLLRLLPDAKKRFHEFHGIEMQNGEVVFPTE